MVTLRFGPLGRVGFVAAAIAVAAGVAECSAAGFDEPRAKTAEKTLDLELLLNSARNAVKTDDIATAIDRFEQLLAVAPDHAEARIEHAGLLFRVGRVREAVSVFELLRGERPGDLELARLLVDALLNLGDHPRAKEVLFETLKLWPDQADLSLRLAKLHALDKEFGQARRAIRAIPPSALATDELRFDAAELHLKLKDATRAAEFLDLLRPTQADAPRFVGAMVRYAMLIGDRDAARRYVERFNAIAPRDVDLRLELAESLYATGYHTIAGKLYRALLDIAPTHLKALLGATRVALRNDQTEVAEAYLKRVPESARARLYLLAVGETRTISGRYVSAKHVLERLVTENADDVRAQLALATLDRAELEFSKSDARYVDLIERGLAEHESRLRWAESLWLQHKFKQSANVCREVLKREPGDVDATVLLARNLVDLECPRDALSLFDEIPMPVTPTPEVHSRLLTARGEALLATGLCDEARDYFNSALALPGGENARARFGLYRIERTAGRPEAAWRHVEEGIDRNEFPIHYVVQINDLAMKRGRRPLARRVLEAGLCLDPENIVLRIRHAQWYGSFSQRPWATTAIEKYEAILACQDDNNKSRLGLARALGSARCYGRSLEVYARLRCEQPWHLLIAREEARLQRFVCDLDVAVETYDENIVKREAWPVDELAEFQFAARPGSELSPTPSPGEPLPSEPAVANVVHPSGLSSGQEAAPVPPLLDSNGFGSKTCENEPWALPLAPTLHQESNLLRLERSAKILHNPNPSCARDYYCRILEEEPHEQHVWFELGQIYGTLGQTCKAIDCYQNLLDVNPNHRDAGIALYGKYLDTRPRLDIGYRYDHSRGRDGLANMDAGRASLGYTWYNPAHEQIARIGYSHLTLDPHESAGTEGNALDVYLERRWYVDWPCWIEPRVESTHLFADVQMQWWDRWVGSRPVVDAGVRIRSRCDIVWTVAGTFGNVLANSESLAQDIYHGGIRLKAAKRIGEHWQSELEYALRTYSDDNWEQVVDFRNRFPFTRDPCQWAVLADYRYWDFEESSVFNADPTDLSGMRHPYFTPNGYSQVDVGLQFKRTLSCVWFDGGHPTWYSLSYRSRWDSEGEHYNIYDARLNWDVCGRLKLQADLSHTDSDVYENTAAHARLIWIFR